MKKIIHKFCLILLLFTCNQIVGRHKIISLIVWVLKKLTGTKGNKKETYSTHFQAHVPFVSIPVRFSMDDAHVKIGDLTEQRNRGEEINYKTCDEITDILFGYAIESKIPIKNENDGTVIGVCDTRNWTKKDTKEEIERERKIIFQQLAMLTPESDESGVITCGTKGFKKKTENFQQKLARLAKQMNLKFDGNRNHTKICNINNWKEDTTKRKRVEDIRKKLVFQSKTKPN